MHDNQIIVPALLGPTSVGKTALAVQLALELNWEIVSCDSRQVYRMMNIGTAKPSVAQLAAVPHHCIDLIDPDRSYSAFEYGSEALSIIRARASYGKTVLVCGGTGLYYRCLSQGIKTGAPSDLSVRTMLQSRLASEGSGKLHDELMVKDPPAASKIHRNDSQRILRALSVIHQTGIPFSTQQCRGDPPEGIRFVTVVLMRDRNELYRMIETRVDQMIRCGLFEEYESLVGKGYGKSSPGMQCVGYRELFSVRDGQCTISKAIDEIKKNTRRYAKRQITWFSNQIAGMVFKPDEYEKVKRYFTGGWKACTDNCRPRSTGQAANGN